MQSLKFDIDKPCLEKTLEQFSLEHVLECLAMNSYHRTATYKSLGICDKTLRVYICKIKKHFSDELFCPSRFDKERRKLDKSEIVLMNLEGAKLEFVFLVFKNNNFNRTASSRSLGICVKSVDAWVKKLEDHNSGMQSYRKSLQAKEPLDPSCPCFPTNEFRVNYLDRFPNKYV